MIKYFVISLLCTILSLSAHSQDISIIEKSCHMDIKTFGSKINVTENYYLSKIFFKNLSNYSKDFIYYSSLDPIKKFEAYTKVPNNKGDYKIIDVESVEDKDVLQNGVFYHDIKNKEFVYPSLNENSIGVLKYSKEITDPHIINTFYFDDTYDCKESKYSITTPISVKIEYSLFNVDTLNIKFVIDTIKDNITYTWTYKNPMKRNYHLKSPSKAYFSPHIIPRICSYKVHNKTITISESIDDLYKWYMTLISKIPNYINKPQIETKVNELVKDAKSDNEKIEIIYKWVQSNIKYIAFEDGMAGFIPRPAGKVFENKYGDCKDMANLLKTMLEIAAIPAYYTWIGTISKPYLYSKIPTTNADNHMICSVKIDDKFFFLDPTSTFTEFPMVSKSIQGKEALVGLNEEDYLIVKIDEIDCNKNLRVDSLKLEINNNVLMGDVLVKMYGFEREDFMQNELNYTIRNKTNLIQDYLLLGKNSSIFTNSNILYNNGSVEIKFDAEFKNDVIETENKLYLNLNLDNSKDNLKINEVENRDSPIFETYKYSYSYYCRLTVPEGYSIEFIPEDIFVNYELFNIKTKYSVFDNKVIFEKKINSNFLVLYEPYFMIYVDFLKNIYTINNQKIILKKN